MEAEDEATGLMIEEEEIYVNGGEDGDESKRHRPIIRGEQLDIKAYATLYTSRTKIYRLLFIAEKCDNASMQLDALRMAYDEIKKGENTQLFREIVAKIDGHLAPNYGPDNAWADALDRRAELRIEKVSMYSRNPNSLNLESDCEGFAKNWESRTMSVGQSLVLDSEKGELVKTLGTTGKKRCVSKTKIVNTLKSHIEAERRREMINAHLAML